MILVANLPVRCLLNNVCYNCRKDSCWIGEIQGAGSLDEFPPVNTEKGPSALSFAEISDVPLMKEHSVS